MDPLSQECPQCPGNGLVVLGLYSLRRHGELSPGLSSAII